VTAGASHAALREPPAAGSQRAARRPGLVRSIMENVEALAIAIVMALILKYFLIEAYKIPTGSMQPQIMGDPPTGIFDRVLVNKLVYLLRDPQRFEVVVFRNPLWQRQNYIKRLVAFGGERVTIRNGDLFITPKGAGPEQERIARKPDAVWRAVRKDLLPERHGVFDLSAHFEAQGSATIEASQVVFKPAAGASASINTRQPIRDHYLDGYHPKWVEAYQDPTAAMATQTSYRNLVGNDVTDVEFAADVTPEAGATAFFVEIREAGRTHRLELAVGTGKSTLETDSGPNSFLVESTAPVAALPLLPVGRTTRVSLRNVDDELVVELDGSVALRRPYVTRGVDLEADPRSHDAFETSVAAGARGGMVGLTDVGLWRDIHYLADGYPFHGARSAVYTVPDGEFMVLGDNTQNSWDCRQWEEGTVELTDGRKITGNYFSAFHHDADSNPDSVGEMVHFRNVYGQEYVFPHSSMKGDFETPSIHSFPERMLLGKALAVFWPLPPFSPTWRLKWVR
jgi:signal peptidase I